jgi:amino acid transporter
MWPAFALCTVATTVLIETLPFSGDGPESVVGSLLLATGLNLVVVAVLAPLGGWLLRRRRPDLPRAIAADVSGTVLLGGLFAALLVAGLVNRSAVQADERARAASYAATSQYVHAQAPAYAEFLGAADIIRLEPDLYRSCVPGPERPLCLIVNTDQSPPGITRDPDQTPNYRE